jgi:hypothetical protein
MSRSECEAVLGAASDTFRKTPWSSERTLAFEDRSIHVSISPQGQVVEVRIFRPREVLLAGVQLLGRPLVIVRRELVSAAVTTE